MVAVAPATTPRRSTPRLFISRRRRAAGPGVRGRLIPMARRGCPSPHPAMGTCRPFRTSVTGRCSWSALSPRERRRRRHAHLWWRHHHRHRRHPLLCRHPPPLRKHPPRLRRHPLPLPRRLRRRLWPQQRTARLRCWGGEDSAPPPRPLLPRSGRGPRLPSCGSHRAPLPHRCRLSAAARMARRRSRRTTCWRGGPLPSVLLLDFSVGVPAIRQPPRWRRRWRPCWTFCRAFPPTSRVVGPRRSASAVGCQRCGRLSWSSPTRLRRGRPTATACPRRVVLCTPLRMGAARWAERRGRPPPAPRARWMDMAAVKWWSRQMDTAMATRTGSAARTRCPDRSGGDDKSATSSVWSSIEWALVVTAVASGHRLRLCQTRAWAAVPVGAAGGCGGSART